MYYYLNNKILPLSQAAIHPNDLGLLRGYAVFDYLRTYNKKPFLLKEHYQRFQRSARALNLKIPVSQKQIETIAKKLIIKNKIKKEASIRLVLTGGQTRDGISYNYNEPTFFILVSELHIYPPHIYQQGGKLITHEYQRDFPQAKTTNYITTVRNLDRMKKAKAIEILYTSNNQITEATRSNFFIFKKNKLITPKDNILLGITRSQVIKLTKKHFKIEQRPVRLKELTTATEAFITSSGTEITPIVKIDNKRIGNGKVGENTKCLMQLFREYTEKY